MEVRHELNPRFEHPVSGSHYPWGWDLFGNDCGANGNVVSLSQATGLYGIFAIRTWRPMDRPFEGVCGVVQATTVSRMPSS